MTLIQFLELKYFVVSVVGLGFTLVLLYGVDQARRENNLRPEDGNDILIRKAGWRYTLMAIMFCLKIALSVLTVLGYFGVAGVLILSLIPDILLTLVWYEWRTDGQQMRFIRSRQDANRADPGAQRGD